MVGEGAHCRAPLAPASDRFWERAIGPLATNLGRELAFGLDG
jgi:hypothetical protein